MQSIRDFAAGLSGVRRQQRTDQLLKSGEQVSASVLRMLAGLVPAALLCNRSGTSVASDQ